jgi:6-phosphogluconolactonase (cycloisomerase 2 family)
MTNASSGNMITVFDRRPDGTLQAKGDIATGGLGTGTPEDSANGLILTGTDAESSPTTADGTGEFLLAANGGSDTITVFRNEPGGLEVVEVEPSGGVRPISITVSRGVAYVLNAGGPMCTGGPAGPPTINGFTIAGDGRLTPIPGSSRPLSGGNGSGCTQLAFDRTGNVLLVEEQQADIISTYTRNTDGTLTGPTARQTTGNGPFGLNFTKSNQLLTTENFGGAPGQGGLASYAIDTRTGALTALSPTVANGESDTCWVAITPNGRFAFTSSFGDDGGISSYRVAPNGALTLLEGEAATVGSGSSDVAMSADGQFLFVKNSLKATVTTFRIGDDGTLRPIDEDRDASAGGGSIGLAASDASTPGAEPGTRPGPGAGAKACPTSQRFKIRLREPRGRERLTSARVTVAGRRVAVKRSKGRLTANIDLRGHAAGRVKVRIIARTSRGRTVRSTRTFRSCG